MADTLEVDSSWVVETLNTICAEMGALPKIEEHLDKQNQAIAKQQAKSFDHELRLLQLEREHKSGQTRWAMLGGFLLKMMQAVGVPLILAHIFGLY